MDGQFMDSTRKYLIIINPISGKGKNEQLISKLKDAFPNNQICITGYKGHPYEVTNREDLDTIDAIIAIGGDGTMHEVVNGMMSRMDGKKVPIGLIPGGTGNSFMHDLQCLNPEKAIEIIKQGHIKKVDLMKLEMGEEVKYAFNIVGWGISVTINNLAEKWRRIGGQRYNLAALNEIIRNPKWPVKITLGDIEVEGKLTFFLACNNMYSGNGMKVAPRAILDDGLVDILLLRQAPRYKLIGIFSKIFDGSHIENSLIEYHQVRSFSIIPEQDTVLNIDGQVEGHTPVNVTVLSKALEVFYPR
jgi:YegS/Rv2252/BmrU family lipid kinase